MMAFMSLFTLRKQQTAPRAITKKGICTIQTYLKLEARSSLSERTIFTTEGSLRVCEGLESGLFPSLQNHRSRTGRRLGQSRVAGGDPADKCRKGIYRKACYYCCICDVGGKCCSDLGGEDSPGNSGAGGTTD